MAAIMLHTQTCTHKHTQTHTKANKHAHARTHARINKQTNMKINVSMISNSHLTVASACNPDTICECKNMCGFRGHRNRGPECEMVEGQDDVTETRPGLGPAQDLFRLRSTRGRGGLAVRET
jgi:hypothetical protein